MLVESQQGSSIGSVSAVSAVQLSALNSLSANEGDFQCSRVNVKCHMAMIPEVVAVASKKGPFYLVLSSGAMTAAQVTAALDGSLNIDLTPAGGDLARLSAAQVRGVILMIPFELSNFVANDNDATAEVTALWVASYNGPPLGMSLEKGRTRSWVFPKNIGWRWMIFAAGNGITNGSTTQLYTRMTGRYLDD